MACRENRSTHTKNAAYCAAFFYLLKIPVRIDNYSSEWAIIYADGFKADFSEEYGF